MGGSGLLSQQTEVYVHVSLPLHTHTHIHTHTHTVLVSSFKPRGAAILSVTIYPSDFGLQRMTQEDVAGPSLPLLPSSQEEAAEEEEGGGFSQERLREYQLQRLQYYYAVVECDSVATAEHVYQCCERVEYEHSGGCLDLR